MNKLNFLTAGIPLRTEPKDYENAFKVLDEMNLDGIELEFVHGVRMSPASQNTVKKASEKFVITAHGPYYINLNSKEQEKIDASVVRILDTALMAGKVGAYSITYHAAFYMGNDKKIVFDRIVKQTQRIIEVIESEGINVWIRPETTGKNTQWGDLDEVIALSKEFKQILPCVDFSHLHARTGGKLNSYEDFCMILERIGSELGQNALDNFHGHLAGIAYSDKGEKHHLDLEKSDMNYKDLLKALKKFDVKGALVCESPNIEEDCKLIKEFYLMI
ncbi:MAG: TIM barrel protein [Candidatus Gastranaerophilales bacterium]|nr:TIM barrel protein [Candidatus Gastranaerophilales bacterium]